MASTLLLQASSTTRIRLGRTQRLILSHPHWHLSSEGPCRAIPQHLFSRLRLHKSRSRGFTSTHKLPLSSRMARPLNLYVHAPASPDGHPSERKRRTLRQCNLRSGCRYEHVEARSSPFTPQPCASPRP